MNVISNRIQTLNDKEVKVDLTRLQKDLDVEIENNAIGFYKTYEQYFPGRLRDGKLHPLFKKEFYFIDAEFYFRPTPYKQIQTELITKYLRTGIGEELINNILQFGEFEFYKQDWYEQHPEYKCKPGIKPFIEDVIKSRHKKTIDMTAVDKFLNRYEKGNDIIKVLRKDLMAIVSDMHWIKESHNENEQFSLDFADALNAISTSI